MEKINTKNSFIEINKEGKQWKIISSKLGRPLTTESVLKATNYLTKICKRLDLTSAAHALEHAKNIGKHIIAGDTYGPNPGAGNAFTSPINREPVSAITSPKDYEVMCDVCQIRMVPDKIDMQEKIRDNYTCPHCGWHADLSGIQEPSLTSDPTSFPLVGPSDYERGGNAFVNYSGYKGNGFTVIAVDEEKKEKKKEKESGLSPAERSVINEKLLDANKQVREYLVTVQVIQQEIKNYQEELSESLGIKELKKQSDLLKPAIKEMLDQLAEHEKQVEGVEYRLKDAHKRELLKSKEEVNPILDLISELVSKKNIEEFNKLRKELYTTTDVKESFQFQLSEQSPEVVKEIEELKKTINLLKVKEDLPKEEIEKIEKEEEANEEPSVVGVSLESRIDSLLSSGLIDEEIAKGLKESYKKDPKSIRKKVRRLEKKTGETPESIKKEEKSTNVLTGSKRVKVEELELFQTTDGSPIKISKSEVISVKEGNDDNYLAYWRGKEMDISEKQIKEETEPVKESKASFDLDANKMADKIKEYWDVVKEFFKEVLEPFTNFITIANSEWKELNESLDNVFGNEMEMAKESSHKIELPKMQLEIKELQKHLQLIEDMLEAWKSEGLINNYELKDSDVEKDINWYNIEPKDGNSKQIMLDDLRTVMDDTRFSIKEDISKEASLNKKAYTYTIKEYKVENPEKDRVILELKPGPGESIEDIWQSIEKSDGTMEDVIQAWDDEDKGLLYIEMLSPSFEEAKDIIDGALGAKND